MKRSFSESFSTLPSAPFTFIPPSVLSSQAALTSFASNFASKKEKEEADREVNKDLNKRFAEALQATKLGIERGNVSGDRKQFDADLASLDVLAKSVLDATSPPPPSNAFLKIDRDYGFSPKLEGVIEIKAFIHFLESGNLLRRPEGYSDEEYMAGIMQFSHDLARYAQGRAILRDSASVEMARDLCDEILAELLKFDFKNGPLRRKYDGVKYAVKKCENILYELSITDRDNKSNDADTTDSNDKNDRQPRLDADELAAIKERMDKYDEKRENVIKKSRDIQKAAKQAIFSLHRGDNSKADKLMETCEKVAAELAPVLADESSLRYGSYSNGMEEYAEARLFSTWLRENSRIAHLDEMPIIKEEEYIGGLCDLTGEVGRVAVIYGAKRDSDSVTKCLGTNLSILNVLQGVHLPAKLHKKLGPLEQSVSKLEQILYEISLIEAKGGGSVSIEQVKMDDATNE